MTRLLTTLQTILQQQLDQCDRLIDTATALHAALRAVDIAEVRTKTAEYDAVAVEMAALEEKRLSAVDELGVTLGCEIRHMSLQMIIDRIDPQLRSPLITLRRELKERFARIHSLSVSNQVLLQEGLQRAALEIDLFTRPPEKLNGYRQGGHKQAAAVNRPLFNATA